MIYPNDFKVSKNFQAFDGKINRKIRINKLIDQENKSLKIKVISLEHEIKAKKISNIKKSGKRIPFMRRYFSESSVHGVRYIVDDKLNWMEKCTWIVLIVVAVICATYVSMLIQQRFSNSLLATVVESTIYPVYEIPYPAVTLCNYNRINWKRVPEAIDFFLPNGTSEARSKLTIFLEILDMLEFGSFTDFLILQNTSLHEFANLNLDALYRRVMLECKDIFIGDCWWRNGYLPCCKIFFIQKTEYGYCYSFNSAVNPEGRQRLLTESDFPWRSSSNGDWTGLRITVQTHLELINEKNTKQLGYLILINHPMQFPTTAYFIPSGTTASVSLSPTYSYSTDAVQQLTVEQRQCIRSGINKINEAAVHNIYSLPGLEYFESNCKSQCRQVHVIKFCNCTTDYFFPSGEYPVCHLTDLKCLFENDAAFNNEKPPKGNRYFSDNEPGIICNCLPECERIEYDMEITSVPFPSIKDDNEILLDIHYRQSTMVRYQTSIVFDWLDLIVGIGGIAGLFLGISLLSVAEIIFHICIATLNNLHWIPKIIRFIFNWSKMKN